MKRTIFFILLSLAFFCSLCLAAENPIKLKVITDKAVYRPGDSIVITVEAENTSAKEIKVIFDDDWPGPFIKVFDSDHHLCEVNASPMQIESERGVPILLGPHKKKILKYGGSIKKGRINIYVSYGKHEYKTKKKYGIVWDVGTWSARYLLPKPGKYYFEINISGMCGKDCENIVYPPQAKGSIEVVDK